MLRIDWHVICNPLNDLLGKAGMCNVVTGACGLMTRIPISVSMRMRVKLPGCRSDRFWTSGRSVRGSAFSRYAVPARPAARHG
jgi:hypothetical protein